MLVRVWLMRKHPPIGREVSPCRKRGRQEPTNLLFTLELLLLRDMNYVNVNQVLATPQASSHNAQVTCVGAILQLL